MSLLHKMVEMKQPTRRRLKPLSVMKIVTNSCWYAYYALILECEYSIMQIVRGGKLSLFSRLSTAKVSSEFFFL